MPCQGRPAVPRGSPCPKSPAQGCQQRGHVNLAASRCLSVPPLHAGVVAATHFPLHGAPAVTPQGCPGLPGAVWGCPGLPGAAQGCPLPAWLNTARPIPPALGGGGLVLLTWPGRPPNLWENTWRLGQPRTHLGSTSCHTAAAHPPVPPWALLLPHDPLPRLLQAVSPLQVLSPRGMQHPPPASPGQVLDPGTLGPCGCPLGTSHSLGGAPSAPILHGQGSR